MQLKATHPIFTANQELNALLTPLKKYHISYFTYRKFYTDHSRIILGTRPDWFEKYFSQKHYLQGNTEANPLLYKKQAVFWSTLANQQIFQFARELGIDHGIYLIHPGPDYCEFFAFASTPNHPEVVNFYLNNLDILENFCLLFKEKANLLIKQAEDDKIVLPFHHQSIMSYQMAELKSIFFTSSLNQKFFISKREMECAIFILQGLTSKEIAQRLSLSYRTIEGYLKTLKQKLRARNKSDLILKLLECGI